MSVNKIIATLRHDNYASINKFSNIIICVGSLLLAWWQPHWPLKRQTSRPEGQCHIQLRMEKLWSPLFFFFKRGGASTLGYINLSGKSQPCHLPRFSTRPCSTTAEDPDWTPLPLGTSFCLPACNRPCSTPFMMASKLSLSNCTGVVPVASRDEDD